MGQPAPAPPRLLGGSLRAGSVQALAGTFQPGFAAGGQLLAALPQGQGFLQRLPLVVGQVGQQTQRYYLIA